MFKGASLMSLFLAGFLVSKSLGGVIFFAPSCYLFIPRLPRSVPTSAPATSSASETPLIPCSATDSRFRKIGAINLFHETRAILPIVTLPEPIKSLCDVYLRRRCIVVQNCRRLNEARGKLTLPPRVCETPVVLV